MCRSALLALLTKATMACQPLLLNQILRLSSASRLRAQAVRLFRMRSRAPPGGGLSSACSSSTERLTSCPEGRPGSRPPKEKPPYLTSFTHFLVFRPRCTRRG